MSRRLANPTPAGYSFADKNAAELRERLRFRISHRRRGLPDPRRGGLSKEKKTAAGKLDKL